MLFVAKHLISQKAVLLQVCHVFLDIYGFHNIEDIKSIQPTLKVEESMVQFSSRWLLHQLIYHLESCCIKFGYCVQYGLSAVKFFNLIASEVY